MKNYRVFIILFAVLAPLFVAGGIVSFQRHARIAQEALRQEERLAELSQEVQTLREEIEYFSSPVNIEMEARKRFNLIRQGEIAVILVPPQAPDPEPAPEQRLSFFERFLQWVRSW